ncbi:hypothetical protein EJF18_80202 [Clavispora lusitaniae]|uniref:Uncharacterized protein n=1 Tax=Clavispora lusitaniae TaxID=36911 RepID=A0ACD0WSD5_CLALS|nr:hypothetical protein EJF14_80202 [Clavispora lusitaniae]QFZ36145.1 hypothetical protein EJF16_80202 [Clavispora lusitaniae]QFZ41829.1 hypothetical protein EJF15_80202 [Clavispora lusitaniae]QFZ47505.1 hypothetical protein EJF18_80202 [Clavispora lusitaniae]QFZ53184.1 hypothetical protein EJF17_80202 [Clavispora lusitaniae]
MLERNSARFQFMLVLI